MRWRVLPMLLFGAVVLAWVWQDEGAWNFDVSIPLNDHASASFELELTDVELPGCVVWLDAGLRVFDIEDPFRPREVGHYVPAGHERMMDPRPNRPRVIQSADCYVDREGLVYLTDSNAGLNILRFEGP